MGRGSRSGLRSFLLGGLLGGAAGMLAAGRLDARRRARQAVVPGGLAAFERAPCHAEWQQRRAARGQR